MITNVYVKKASPKGSNDNGLWSFFLFFFCQILLSLSMTVVCCFVSLLFSCTFQITLFVKKRSHVCYFVQVAKFISIKNMAKATNKIRILCDIFWWHENSQLNWIYFIIVDELVEKSKYVFSITWINFYNTFAVINITNLTCLFLRENQ